ncbi:MAG: tetratricopeptide repeat protein [Calditrichaeota bacterium]|nr:tetratricopeptide repeat protein [Calditrichota bacterium]MCB9367804.1 tetratricopeptide repeat protein [Calditrichota bacterium]
MTFFEFLFLLILVGGGIAAASYFRDWKVRRNVQPTTPYAEGLRAILDGDTPKAIQKLRETVGADTNNIDAYLRLGQLFAQSGDLDRATKIHRALTLRGDLVDRQKLDIYRALSEDYLKNGDYNRALESVNQMLGISKKDAWALQQKSEILAGQGQWQAAYESAEKLNGLTTATSGRRLALLKTLEGERLCNAGKERDGRVQFRQAIKHDATLVAPYLYWGDSYVREHRVEDAVKIWRRLIDVNPAQSYVAFERLETHLFDLGRFSEIEQIYREVIHSYPQNVHAYAALSRFLRKKGDAGGAITTLRDGLEHNPESLWLRRRLIRMYHDVHDVDGVLNMSRDVLSRVMKENYEYSCSNCGNVSHEPLWVCPKCNKVDSYNV